MNPFTNPALMGLVRHALTTAGGFLVARGYIDAEMLSSGVGAVLTLGGIAWSVADKKTR